MLSFKYFKGPPDTPSNFGVQYMTHVFVSLQWRCKWCNGYEQTVFIRLTDVATNLEVETQFLLLAAYCYNSIYSTLFQSNIQSERDYEATIWSINIYGSSNVVKLAVRTPKRLLFETSPSNISIKENQATINFRIVDSTKSTLLLNVTCCVESMTQCSNQSYIISNADNQVVFDMLPTGGSEYVYDFIVYDSDGFTYTYTLAILKGVRMSITDGESTSGRNQVVKDFVL